MKQQGQEQYDATLAVNELKVNTDIGEFMWFFMFEFLKALFMIKQSSDYHQSMTMTMTVYVLFRSIFNLIVHASKGKIPDTSRHLN
jgi:hypothetical protein